MLPEVPQFFPFGQTVREFALTPVRVAFVRSTPVKAAPLRFALVRLAEGTTHPPTICAPLRFALLRFAFNRVAPCRSALLRFA